MANTTGEKELKTDWPVTTGLTAKTTKQTGRVMNLVPQTNSKVLRRRSYGCR